MSIDLDVIGSPDKYRVMFYAEDKKRDISIWKTDYTSWIDIPKPQLILTTTPSSIELRPDNKDIIGIQVTSNTGFLPQLSNFIVKDKVSNIELNNIGNKTGNAEPIPFQIKIPPRINPGKYMIPMLANITTNSTIPYLEIPYLNLGYSFEQVNLPVTILRSFTDEEKIINFWKDWGSPLAFIIGIVTGKIGSSIFEVIRRRVKKNNKKTQTRSSMLEDSLNKKRSVKSGAPINDSTYS